MCQRMRRVSEDASNIRRCVGCQTGCWMVRPVSDGASSIRRCVECQRVRRVSEGASGVRARVIKMRFHVFSTVCSSDHPLEHFSGMLNHQAIVRVRYIGKTKIFGS